MNNRSDLRKHLGPVLTWWWVVLLFVAAAVAASYFYTSRQTRMYKATVTVIVGQSIQLTDPTSQDLDTSRRLAQTYALLIRRQPIMQAVDDTLQLEGDWRSLRSRTKVYLVPTTQLIEITVESSQPENARVTADEIARQLILYSPTLQKSQEDDETLLFVNERLARLKEKITSRQAEIDRKEEAYLKAGLESQRQAIEKEINRLEGQIGTWESNYSRLLVVNQTSESTNYVMVVEPAQADKAPFLPDVRTNTLLAGAAGLIAGLLFALLLNTLDDTLKSEDDLEQETGLVPLGMVNQMKGKTDLLITHQNPFSIAQEAYRMIRSNIQFLAVDRPSKTIMITSAGAGEGKSLTAANVSLTMAQAGLTVILVDADLRQPKQHSLFHLDNRAGLTDLLTPSQPDITQALNETAHNNLKVITSGTRPPNPAELLGSQRMVHLLGELSMMADVVILDSMPVLSAADSVVLSNRLDGVILVVDSSRTRKGDVRRAIHILLKADARIWGAILNRVSRKKTRYYSKEFVPDTAAPLIEKKAV